MCLHHNNYYVSKYCNCQYRCPFSCSDGSETVSISQAILQAKRAIEENCPNYLNGYLALTDAIIDLIQNAKPSDFHACAGPLKKV